MFGISRKRGLFGTCLMVVCLGLVSCARYYQPQSAKWSLIEVKAEKVGDGELSSMLAPYRDSISGSMQKEIGVVSENLNKTGKENTLGNFVADAILYGARKHYPKVDVAFMNRSGIRINELTEGNLSVQKVFELMPFDNLLLCIEVKGKVLRQILTDEPVLSHSWPIAGASVMQKDNKEFSVKINGTEIVDDNIYFIAISDYLADNGYGAKMFDKMPRHNANYLQRDAVADYVKDLTAQQKVIEAPDLNRIMVISQ